MEHADRWSYLASLQDGWFPDALAPSQESIRVAKVVAAGLPEARIFPTPQGGVQLEWLVAGRMDLDVMISCDGRRASIHGMSMNGILADESRELRLWLAERAAHFPADVRREVRAVARCFGVDF